MDGLEIAVEGKIRKPNNTENFRFLVGILGTQDEKLRLDGNYSYIKNLLRDYYEENWQVSGEDFDQYLACKEHSGSFTREPFCFGNLQDPENLFPYDFQRHWLFNRKGNWIYQLSDKQTQITHNGTIYVPKTSIPRAIRKAA
ncbi:MAG: hypothetical protein ACOCXG_02630 [Nanoarchaeota archaeon]